METEGKLRADDWTIDRRWSCRRGHLESANEPRPGQIRWTDPPIHSPPKEFVFNRVARGETAGDLAKNCHLLQSTAILEPQNRCAHCNRSIPYLPVEGVPASLGPGLRTVRGAKRSLGGMLPSGAVCAVTAKSTAKDECITECEKGRQLINLARNSERAERTRLRSTTPHSCETNPNVGENMTNEATDAREIVPNEPRLAAAVGLESPTYLNATEQNATNEATDAREIVTNEPKLAAAVGLESPTYLDATEQNATNEVTDASEIVTNEPKLAAAVGLESPTYMDACRSENEPGVRSGFPPPFPGAPPRLTSRAVTCALPSQFAGRVVTVTGDLHRYKPLRIGDLWPRDC
jgi:hypothetical protein